MPAITDKFGMTSAKTAYANATTVKVSRQVGESVLMCHDLSKFPRETNVYFVTYKKVADPTDPKKVNTINQTSWKGKVNPDNNTIVELTLAPGYTDIGNFEGDFVEPIPTSYWCNDLVEGILVSHNQDGSIKDGSIKFNSLDLSAEYIEQNTSINFNDPKFLKAGKWVLRDKDVAKTSTNRPSDSTGWLTVTPLDPNTVPGVNAHGYVMQQYVDTESRIYKRIIKSGDTPNPIEYKDWLRVPTEYPSIENAKEESVQIGWGMILKLTRIGNTVSAYIDQINEVPGGVFSPSEKIPKKYRPINNMNMLITGINSGRYAGNAMYKFAKDGSVTGYSALPGRQEWYGSVTWLTDQPWEKS